MKINYELYWEDITERLLYAEIDDYAWQLPEKIFRYQKRHSLYVYHQGKLAAYYWVQDSKKEASVGYSFYSKARNLNRVVQMKKKIFSKVRARQRDLKKIEMVHLSNQELKNIILDSLDLFYEALSVHYLSQPQFFEKFNSENLGFKNIQAISQARFKYTRVAWTEMLELIRTLLKEYGKRKNLSLEELESFRLKELRSGELNRKKVQKRVSKFAFTSHNHTLHLVTGKKVDQLIKKYESYQEIQLVKGVVGNKGKVAAKCFVVKNENLNFNSLPKGMKKGMILIVQNSWPELSKFFNLASAIVTNEGGITSHGVVVARELDIPCVVGTKIATKIFKTGDKVEVDANQGIVRKL